MFSSLKMPNHNVTFYYLENSFIFEGYCFISEFIPLPPYFLPFIYPSVFYYFFQPERQESCKGVNQHKETFQAGFKSFQLHDGKHHSELQFHVSSEY